MFSVKKTRTKSLPIVNIYVCSITFEISTTRRMSQHSIKPRTSLCGSIRQQPSATALPAASCRQHIPIRCSGQSEIYCCFVDRQSALGYGVCPRGIVKWSQLLNCTGCLQIINVANFRILFLRSKRT